MLDWQVLARELQRHGLHIVHGDHFVGTDVHRLGEVALGETQDALDAIVDVGERARLLTVTPHFDFAFSRRSLTAERRRRLFATALPRAVRTVNVVESTDARLNTKILLVVLVHFLARELFETVRVLRLRRPRARFLQPVLHLRAQLRALRVDARARRVKASRHALHPHRFHHIEGNHHVVVEDDGVVGLNESHASHVRREVEAVVAPLENLFTVFVQPQISQDELIAEHRLLHVFIALPIARHDVMSLLFQSFREMRPDETSRARHANLQLLLRPVLLRAVNPAQFVPCARRNIVSIIFPPNHRLPPRARRRARRTAPPRAPFPGSALAHVIG